MPCVPLVIVPVTGSITAKSPTAGNGSKLKTPPVSPVIVAVAPSHVGVKLKVALKVSNVVNVIGVEELQLEALAYSIV